MMMTTERWKKIERVLNDALELPNDKRDAFLNQVCAQDHSLRKEVVSLIRFRQLASHFIEQPPIRMAAALLQRDHTQSGSKQSLEKPLSVSVEPTNVSEALSIGTTLKDRYVIDKELAHGFSVVYLAHDKQLLSRRVVIKVLVERREQSEDDLWYKRKFRQEIEALAR